MPTHYRGRPEDTRALDTWIKLTRAVDSFGARLAGHGTCSNVTISQFGVLEALHHLGPLRQGEISAKLLRSGGNITLVVDNLEVRGLVRRERDALIAGHHGLADRGRRSADRRAIPATRPRDRRRNERPDCRRTRDPGTPVPKTRQERTVIGAYDEQQ